jgi:hypothetical protein
MLNIKFSSMKMKVDLRKLRKPKLDKLDPRNLLQPSNLYHDQVALSEFQSRVSDRFLSNYSLEFFY